MDDAAGAGDVDVDAADEAVVPLLDDDDAWVSNSTGRTRGVAWIVVINLARSQ